MFIRYPRTTNWLERSRTLLTNCSEMPVHGSYWTTRYFMVCEQTFSFGHKMDQCLWQTFGASRTFIIHLNSGKDKEPNHWRRFTHGWIGTSSSLGLCLKHCPVSQPRGTLSVTHAIESCRLIHILALDFWSQAWPRSTQHSQQFTLNPTVPVQRQMRQWSKCSKKDEAQTWGTSKKHRVNLDWLFERLNLDRYFFGKIRATKRSIGGYVDKGTVSPLKRTYASNDVRSFSRKPFSCSALGKPQAMSQVNDTNRERWREMESLRFYASKVLKSSGALDIHLTLEQLRKYEF